MQAVGGREAIPILEDEVLLKKLENLRVCSCACTCSDAPELTYKMAAWWCGVVWCVWQSFALDRFSKLAPVAASERASNEYYTALSEELTAEQNSLRAENQAKSRWRYFLGAVVPGAVLAVHVAMTLFGASFDSWNKRYQRIKVLKSSAHLFLRLACWPLTGRLLLDADSCVLGVALFVVVRDVFARRALRDLDCHCKLELTSTLASSLLS